MRHISMILSIIIIFCLILVSSLTDEINRLKRVIPTPATIELGETNLDQAVDEHLRGGTTILRVRVSDTGKYPDKLVRFHSIIQVTKSKDMLFIDLTDAKENFLYAMHVGQSLLKITIFFSIIAAVLLELTFIFTISPLYLIMTLLVIYLAVITSELNTPARIRERKGSVVPSRAFQFLNKYTGGV